MAYGGFINDAAAELGRNPVSKHQIQDGTAEPVSRDQMLRHARGQGNINFPCSADHEQDWQPCPVDPYSAICDDHTYMLQCMYVCIYVCMYVRIYVYLLNCT